MKVTPHLAIETIQDIGPMHPCWRSPQALGDVLAILSRAVHFDFGVIHPDMAHKDFALDLYERGLFKLPFPVVAFSFEAKPNPAGTFNPGDTIAGGMMVVSQGRDGGLSGIMFTERRDPDTLRSDGAIPIGLLMNAKFSEAAGGSVKVTNDAALPIISNHLMVGLYGSSGARGHKIMQDRLCSNMVGCMGMAVMLMSKGVDVEHRLAPSKLNKSRAARGKPPIRAIYAVRLNVGDRYVISNDVGDESIEGHTRGSPRMHWRRGHFRTLARGTDGERVIPVAPALIGANEQAEPIRRAYAVNV